MKYKCLFICVLCIQLLNAQDTKSNSFEIFGTLISKSDQLPLESATVYLEQKKDSSLVTYTLTDENGSFSLEGKTQTKQLNLKISYVGFKAYQKEIDVSKETNINLKNIELSSNVNELNTVELKASPPITIKKDTIEFNVRSFKTKKDANVEDLLKKLPGAEVDENGAITINGKPVNKILVNGKPFFGNDPTIATRNFPKDIIEKVQVVDTKTKAQAFTGEQSEGENKTVNLVIKEENNKGVFGRAAAGYGTDERYQYAGMYNRFDNDQKFSALAGGNNVNSPGFSYGEIRDMFGGNINSYDLGRGRGITTSDNIGFNYADDFGKNIAFNSDYFFSTTDSDSQSTSTSQKFLEDETFFSSHKSNSSELQNKHLANLELDIKKDSTWLINISPSFKFNQSNNVNQSNGTSLNEERDTLTVSTYSSIREGNDYDFTTNADVTRLYGTGGGFVKLNSSVKIGAENNNQFIESNAIVKKDSSQNVIRNQAKDVKNSSQDLSASITLRQPLVSKKLFLDFKYSLQRNQNLSDQKTFDYDETIESYGDFNSNLSNDYTNINQSHVPGVSLSFKNKKISIRLANYYRFRTLENKDHLRPEFSIKRNFNNFEQYSNIRYKFNNKSSISFNYRYENRAPYLRNMQAFVDISNPTNTVIGNPDLKPQTSHNIHAYYNYFNHQKKYGFSGYVYGNIINDETVTDRTIDANNITTTRYTNVDGNFYISSSVEGNKTFKITDKKSLLLRLRVRPRYRRNIDYNNGVLYSGSVSSLSPSLNVRYNWRDVLEFSTRYEPEYSKTKYNLASMQGQNQSFTRHRVSFDTTTKVPKKLEWSNSLNYNYNPNVSDGFQKSFWFWNMNISYSVLKDTGLISLKAFDILNQNTSVGRWAYGNTISDYQSNVLKQYFMLGFSWKFNTLGKKGARKTRHQEF